MLLLALLAGGCTRESLRVALAAQRRADQIHEAVFERQHEALCLLLYRDMCRRLAENGPALSEAQQRALSAVWGERDLLEFWLRQHERARALRLIGVDTKLYSEQSVLEQLGRSLLGEAKRLQAEPARHLAEQAAEAAAPNSD